MNICFIGPAGSTHLEKWCKYLHHFGHSITIISLVDYNSSYADVISLTKDYDWKNSDLKKAISILRGRKIRKIIKSLNPDVINVHYATSYGLMAAISGIHGYILSVWGADVYDFPHKSFIHRLLLEYSLRKAKHIFSTSEVMREETLQYTSKSIDITPFGVDMELFNPNKRNRSDDKIVIGTVKTLSEKYGISYMIKAFSKACSFYPDKTMELRIAGQGPDEIEYKNLVKTLHIEDKVSFLGFISQEEAACEWANMDIGIIYSTLESESFGVSAVEALASGVPVIISDVPGLLESTGHGDNSIVVPRKNQEQLDDSLIQLIRDDELRLNLSRKGRNYVCNRFSAEKCFRDIESLFRLYSK